MTTERQKQGIDGQAPTARELKDAGEYKKVNLDARAGDEAALEPESDPQRADEGKEGSE